MNGAIIKLFGFQLKKLLLINRDQNGWRGVAESRETISRVFLKDPMLKGEPLLLHQENAVTAEFAAISEDLDVYHQEINDSRDKVETIGEAAPQFSDVVIAMQGSQVRLSVAVSLRSGSG